MSLARSARIWASIVLLACAPLARSQTIEIYAGAARYHDAPATSVAINPEALAFGPDGKLYILDFGGSLYRYDQATETVSSMPGLPDEPEFNFFSPSGMAFDSSGFLYVAAGNLYQLLPYNRQRDDLGPFGTNMPVSAMVFAGDGSLVYPLPDQNRVRGRRGSNFTFAIAGNGSAGFSGDGGPATQSRLNQPSGVVVDASGNYYIADTQNRRIRKVSGMTGIITTIAGTGQTDFNGDNRSALSTNLCMPSALVLDAAGNLLIGDACQNRVRKLNFATNTITTVAGSSNYVVLWGDGGPATQATLSNPNWIALDSNGNLYIADGNSRVRMVNASTGIINTVVGNGTWSFCGENVAPRSACLSYPTGLTFDASGGLLFSDNGNQRIRRISADGSNIATFVGSAHPIDDPDPVDVAIDRAGNVYAADSYAARVRRVDSSGANSSIIAGTGLSGFSGDGGPGSQAQVGQVSGVAVDAAGNVYLSDTTNHRIRRVDSQSGIITTIAGTGLSTGPLGDGGLALAASLNNPGVLRFDPSGNLVFVDGQHYRLRRINMVTGIIDTIAGNGDGNYVTSGDGGPATAASIGSQPSFTFDPAGNIFLGWSYKIRRIDRITGIIDAVPTPLGGLNTFEGIGIQQPLSLAFDSAGRLYVGDGNDHAILRVTGFPYEIADTTPSQINYSINGTAGQGGWYRSDVTVSWTVSDAESALSSSSGCTSSSVTTDTAGFTLTCSATSAGGTATQSVTVRRDTAPPTLTFGAPAPAPDANGFNSGDVSVPFTVGDALSGVYSTSSPSPVVITGEGLHLTASVIVTDQAGNSATFTTPEASIDRSPPVVEPHILGSYFVDGWYYTNVQVSWQVYDEQSFVTSEAGCDPVTISNDTAGVSITCTAISSGGTNSKSVTIKRDATPPVVTFGTPTPSLGPNGWYTGAVSIPWSVSDATSGFEFADLPNPIIISEEGAGITRRLTVRDVARNSIIVNTPPVNIDLSPPTVLPMISGTLGNNGWYKSDVQVSWSINESPASILSTSGCGNSSVTADTTGVTFMCSVTSGGGSASSSVTIKRDATAPVLTFGAPSPAPNASGWNKTNVNIPFTRSDGLSGLASTSTTSPLVLSTEGANVTGQVVVTDNAGNSTTFTSVTRNIDKTAPVLTFTSPADGASFGFYQDVFANYSCTDVSLTSCSAPLANGEQLTKTSGSRSLKLTAKDSVSLTTSETHYFYVEPYFNWNGFLPPASEPITLNLVARGAVVPIHWQLADGAGGWVSNPASFVSATVATLTCGNAAVVPLNESASGPGGLSYDPASGTFTYNWETTASWTGCRKLTIKLKDSTTHELRFKFQ